ncbi:IclR family transcriptional regulator [Halosimplex salinum]|uniref:IclR family transcriptional regulator n=1 Tax=Halosimplex salinum TaxID=1710538 RepID=UPI000F4819ED|nr:IclR family transcriptional regulator [Halosimplex salinum]
MTGSDSGTGKTIQSVETSLRVVDALRERDRAGVTEIAGALGCSKAAVHHHVSTLCKHGYLERVDGEYRLGLGFLSVGGQVREAQPLYHLAEEDVRDLAAETGEQARLVAEHDGSGITIFRATGERDGRGDRPRMHLGSDEPLYCTAAGKAFLAELPEDRIDRYLAETPLESYTDATVTDPELLREELATIRAEGVAFDDEERYEGVRCVASAVDSPGGELLGAISVSGPTERLSGERFRTELPDLLRNVVGVVELENTYATWTEQFSQS